MSLLNESIINNFVCGLKNLIRRNQKRLILRFNEKIERNRSILNLDIKPTSEISGRINQQLQANNSTWLKNSTY